MRTGPEGAQLRWAPNSHTGAVPRAGSFRHDVDWKLLLSRYKENILFTDIYQAVSLSFLQIGLV